jgi:HAD superfamily hydrolase (TIGR01662 family)
VEAPAHRWVVLDVGETLIDESRTWRAWADELGVSHLEFMSVFGAVVARGQGYPDVVSYFPGVDWAARRDAVHERLGGLTEEDLFADVRPSLDELRGSGYRVAIIGNQPKLVADELRALGVHAEVMVMSGEMGVMKPDPEFFRLTLDLLGDADPGDVAYVGDRIDNDVLPSSAAGMHAVWLRRGPWGVVPREEPAEADLIVDSLAELAQRIDEAWR